MSARPKMTALAALVTLLATTSLSPLFADAQWFPPTLCVVLLVALCGAATRHFRVPAPGEAVVAAAVVLEFVTLWFAPRHLHLGFLPSGRSLHDLHVLLQQAGHDIAHLTAPAPTTDGLVLLTVLAVAGLAFVVDLAAVTARVPALTGLPFLAAYAVASGLAPHGVGVLPFLLGAAGWLALLLVDHRDRLARWGRPLGSAAAEPAPMAAAGRRIGAAALGIAIVVPFALPGITHVRFGDGNGPGDGGSSSITTFNPLVSIRDELNRQRTQTLLVVRSTDPHPDYLRMTTLDRFDGAVWSSSQLKQGPEARVRNGIPASPDGAATPTRTVRTDVQVLGLQVHWLPLPPPPTAVDVDGDWRYDARSGTVFSARDDTAGLVYSVTTDRLLPDVATLRAAPDPGPGLRDYLQLPKSLPRSIAQLAEQVTAGSATDYDRAVALQDWFRGPSFTYDVDVAPGNSGDAILEFLQNRHGFCEQFAATMAVMARTLGIPARVAVGFTPGSLNANGTRTITTDDAHAWPELYFSGVGWLRFEPTPRSDGQASEPAYSVPGNSGDGSAGGQDGVPTTQPSAAPSLDPGSVLPAPAVDPSASSGDTGPAVPWTLVLVLALLAAVAAAPASARLALRRRRWGGPADLRSRAAWAELRDDVVDVGLPWWPADSPRGAARRLATKIAFSGTGAAALARVVAAEERARYAPPGREVGGAGLAGDVRALRRELRAAVPRRRRVLATLVPPSTVRRAGTAVSGALARVFEALDAAWPALRRWGRTRLRARA